MCSSIQLPASRAVHFATLLLAFCEAGRASSCCFAFLRGAATPSERATICPACITRLRRRVALIRPQIPRIYVTVPSNSPDTWLTYVSTASPSRSLRILEPTALLATLSSISRLPPRPSAPFMSSPARRSSSARFLSSSPASRSPLERRQRLPTVRVLATRALAAAPLAVVGAEAVVVVDEALALAAPLV